MGVMLSGWSNWDCSSSLTRAISWRGRHRIRIGQKPVGGIVAGIGVDRFPAFHKGKLLEAEVGVHPRQARAAGREVRIQQQL